MAQLFPASVTNADHAFRVGHLFNFFVRGHAAKGAIPKLDQILDSGHP